MTADLCWLVPEWPPWLRRGAAGSPTSGVSVTTFASSWYPTLEPVRELKSPAAAVVPTGRFVPC
jgi:hypothetical protein